MPALMVGVNRFSLGTFLFLSLASALGACAADDTEERINRAAELRKVSPSLLTRDKIQSHWTDGGLVYEVNVRPGESEFIRVDLRTGGKSPAFDHIALAHALSKAAGRPVAPSRLPLRRIKEAGGDEIRFLAFGKSWIWSAVEKILSPDTAPPAASQLLPPEKAAEGTLRNGGATELIFDNATAGEIEIFWVNRDRERKSYGKIPSGGRAGQSTYAGHVWLFTDGEGTPIAGVEATDLPSIARITGPVAPPSRTGGDLSPDGKLRAKITGHNVTLESTTGGPVIRLTKDGSPTDSYRAPFKWSPDSRKLVAFRTKEVKERQISIVQSSPPDQFQPKVLTFGYAKPGDEIRQPQPRLFDISSGSEIPIDNRLFSNPWSISELGWSAASSEFSFAYNQRGHQIMRVVGVRAEDGAARVIIEDTSATFIDYSQKFHLHRLPETREIIWASERSGWNHLYLIDEATGRVKNAITRGGWNVREVVEVDEKKRELLLKVVGLPGQDPYHVHFMRVRLDGSVTTRLTDGDGTHKIEFSPDRKHFIDIWSRVDQPPVTELRDADTGKLVGELERGDDTPLLESGWSRPERFTAKGRDGMTDIQGVIIRPTHFDPAKKYPVLEDIYAGPHDHFVPKAYSPWSGMQSMAELGFIVVKIDGMGTNWRGKAFHDVCWKNLMDSGFPDRIPWIKEAAATRPWMDITRVGIYGGSAGGQSTLAGLLHHGDFYKAGVADCGCHDNRMDKIWWNEAWMGWPVDESYARNSNVTHAAKLTGKLMLIVGEIDRNVDPASTARVVAALQDAGKDFEFVLAMNTGHGAAETPYGNLSRARFLTRALAANP